MIEASVDEPVYDRSVPGAAPTQKSSPDARLPPRRQSQLSSSEEAEESGLLALGGDLSPQRLLTAYAMGIFPWYQEEPILWYSPAPPHSARPGRAAGLPASSPHPEPGPLRAAPGLRVRRGDPLLRQRPPAGKSGHLDHAGHDRRLLHPPRARVRPFFRGLVRGQAGGSMEYPSAAASSGNRCSFAGETHRRRLVALVWQLRRGDSSSSTARCTRNTWRASAPGSGHVIASFGSCVSPWSSRPAAGGGSSHRG